MPEDNEIDENGELRKKIFKPKSTVGFSRSDAANTVFDQDNTRKKIFTVSQQNDSGRVFYETKLKEEEISQEINTEPKEAPTKRVSDVLKSLSKFDEDIARLRGTDNTNFKSTDASIDQLSTDEMEKELKTFLLNRDIIKSDLDRFVMRVNQSSHDLEQEEEKIRKIKIQIQKEIGAKTGD